MKRLSDKVVIDKCGDCEHCFDAFSGEYDKPFGITPEDYKFPECSNLPMTDNGTFPKVDINKIHPSCLLKEVEVITDKDSIDYMVCCVPEVYIKDTESIEKILIIRKAKESE